MTLWRAVCSAGHYVRSEGENPPTVCDQHPEAELSEITIEEP